MLRNKLQVFGLCFFLILVSPLWALAQDAPDPVPLPLVYACIDPDGADPYVLTLRDADMSDHIVGFVVPKRARVTVYSAQSDVHVGVYSIASDAQTGGYRRTGMIAKAAVRGDIPVSERPCSNQFPSLIDDKLGSTIPLPVSPDQAVIIQLGGNNLLDTAPFLGAFTFHFRPDSGEAREDIQLIQLSGGENGSGIEVSFPYITESTRLVIIANKEFRLRTSFSQTPGDFLSQALSNSTEGFAKSLEQEKAGDPPTPLNLFQIMKEGVVRIYPAFGLVGTYPTGGFLRLEMSPVVPDVRVFPENQTIAFLDGRTEFCYVVVDTPSISDCKQIRNVKIVGTRDTGELIVNIGGPDLIVQESWLVVAKQP